ncbi:MAG: M20/M25/M40 family metallo-hydrolase [Caulobacteraceae bacterium]|nr:M20/M25/M40 family metallo-hydrolase [Caulobacteraceae bacterium]
MKRLALAVVLALALPATGLADEPTVVKLRDRAMAGDSIAWPFVSELTTRFGPRPAGSASEAAAAAWAAKELKRLGFSNVRVEPFPLVGWIRGEEEAVLLADRPQPLVAAALGGSPPTPAGGVEGEVVVFASLEELKAAPAGSLAGRIAMVDGRTVRTQSGQGYGAAGAARAWGPSEAAKKGAVAYLVRSIGTSTHRFAHTGSTRYVDGKVAIPAFALSNADADQIGRLAALGERPRVRLSSTASYAPNTRSQHVIAEVRGREKPDEIVLAAAHLDSWDQGTGAIDDAAGVAIIAAAAKLIADLPQRPRRTVRIVFYGAEEVTQPHASDVGGRAYSEPRAGEIGRHVLAGESDFGAGRVFALALPPKAAEAPFGREALRLLGPIGVIPSQRSPGRGGVDIAPLASAGVPVFALEQDGTDYFDFHHTADDTLDKIDRQALDQNVAAWATLLWLAADSEVDFRALAAS